MAEPSRVSCHDRYTWAAGTRPCSLRGTPSHRMLLVGPCRAGMGSSSAVLQDPLREHSADISLCFLRKSEPAPRSCDRGTQSSALPDTDAYSLASRSRAPLLKRFFFISSLLLFAAFMMKDMSPLPSRCSPLLPPRLTSSPRRRTVRQQYVRALHLETQFSTGALEIPLASFPAVPLSLTFLPTARLRREACNVAREWIKSNLARFRSACSGRCCGHLLRRCRWQIIVRYSETLTLDT